MNKADVINFRAINKKYKSLNTIELEKYLKRNIRAYEEKLKQLSEVKYII